MNELPDVTLIGHLLVATAPQFFPLQMALSRMEPAYCFRHDFVELSATDLTIHDSYSPAS